ncbi:MAG: hypothetical protein J2P24_11185 [Streptosporangiales bacterium]|nr:hypothetical protein [Streptosporangiales bacterium]
MFERFTDEARAVVVRAQADARLLHHGHVGCEHLLLAAAEGETPAGQALRDLGCTPEAVRTQLSALRAGAAASYDRDALASIGIDLDAVRERVEAAFGPGALERPPVEGGRRFGLRRRRNGSPGSGHVPFTPLAKKCLELALREASARHDRRLGAEHLVLALSSIRGGLAPRVLARIDVSPAQLRWEVERRYRQAG